MLNAQKMLLSLAYVHLRLKKDKIYMSMVKLVLSM